jgi:trimeric autotransporter adhesin
MRIARFAASIASLAVLLALVGLGGCSSAGSGTPGLQSVEVTPPNSHAAAGTSEQLAATAVYSDGSHQDVTMLVTWSSSDTSHATVTASGANGGLVTALTPGAVKITAALKGMTGSTGLTVTPAVLVSLEVTPATPSVPRGVSKQFVAMGVFSDHSTQNLTTQVTWASANTAVATVSNTQGSQGQHGGHLGEHHAYRHRGYPGNDSGDAGQPDGRQRAD